MSAALCFDGQIASELRSHEVPVILLGEVRLRRPDSVWRARGALTGALERNRYDAVVCHQAWPHAIFGPAVASAGIPLVLWVHTAGDGRHWLDRLARRVRPDTVVCNSRYTASRVVSSAPVEVVYYPRPAQQDRSDDCDRHAIRCELNTPPDDVVIIQVSRMEELKGHRVCLDALSRLKERPGWTCWQVGGAQRPAEEKYELSLRTQAARLGIADRIRFAGHRSDVQRLLGAADVFCQPNILPDAFGLTFVEALAAGVPVVTSAIGGAPEIVDATCGLLVEAGDPASLAAALDRLMTDEPLRRSLAERGPERARLLCDPARQMPRIAALLENAACRTHQLR